MRDKWRKTRKYRIINASIHGKLEAVSIGDKIAWDCLSMYKTWN